MCIFVFIPQTNSPPKIAEKSWCMCCVFGRVILVLINRFSFKKHKTIRTSRRSGGQESVTLFLADLPAWKAVQQQFQSQYIPTRRSRCRGDKLTLEKLLFVNCGLSRKPPSTCTSPRVSVPTSMRVCCAACGSAALCPWMDLVSVQHPHLPSLSRSGVPTHVHLRCERSLVATCDSKGKCLCIWLTVDGLLQSPEMTKWKNKTKAQTDEAFHYGIWKVS